MPLTVILNRLLGGAAKVEVVAALRTQKETAAAVKAAKSVVGSRPLVEDWVLARIVGDGALEKKRPRRLSTRSSSSSAPR